MRWRAIAAAAIVGAGVLVAAGAATQPTREPNTLYIGEWVVSVRDVRRLTNLDSGQIADFDISPGGNMVAFAVLARDTTRVGMLPTVNGGRTTWVEVPGDLGRMAWSPDERSLALSTTGNAPAGPAALWLVETSGADPRRLMAADTMGDIAWSQDGEMLAVACERNAEHPGERSGDNIVILKLRAESRQEVGQSGTDLRFSPDGGTLSFTEDTQDARGAPARNRVEYNLATAEKKRRRQPASLAEGFVSPDGAKAAVQTSQPQGDLVVRDARAGAPVRITWNGASTFGAWSPDGRMIAYVRDYPFTDDARRPAMNVPSLWVTPSEGVDVGRQMLVSPCVDKGSPVKWSPRGDAVAYLMFGDLWMATGDARLMSPADRVAAGAPWTPEAVRQVALSNVRQIGLAMLMYAEDHDHCLPPEGAQVEDLLEPYLKRKTLFYHPAEPDKFIFKYVLNGSEALADISDASSTPMAVLDVDEEWEAVCFADGHALMRRKQQ